MNWEQIEGKWNQLKGDIRSQWAKLTDDDITNAGAKKDRLVGIIQERYGILKDEAEQQIDGWLSRLEKNNDKARS